MCGGIASDPRAVPILLGLGVDELSVSLPAIPAVKAQIRALRLDACRELAERALAAESAEDVRALVPDPDAGPSTSHVKVQLTCPPSRTPSRSSRRSASA